MAAPTRLSLFSHLGTDHDLDHLDRNMPFGDLVEDLYGFSSNSGNMDVLLVDVLILRFPPGIMG